MRWVFALIVCLCIVAEAQSELPGKIFRYELKNAPFPHAMRSNGYTYKNTVYPADKHYSDSTVLVYVPRAFNPNEQVNIIVYFHGWYSCIDSSNTKMRLAEQVEASGIPAIFIFPEGPKYAPDSFGGKLEEKGRFANMLQEVYSKLTQERVLPEHFQPGKIILAGHSGAFRVLSYILFRGGMEDKVTDVILFDALYGGTAKYLHWLASGNKSMYLIYTEDGGTKSETEDMMTMLAEWHTPFTKIDRDEFSLNDFLQTGIYFVASKLTHNEVIATKDQFKIILESIKSR